MFGPINMNRNELIGITDSPKFGYSAVNKTYVTNQLNSKLDKIVNDDLNMNNKKIINLTTDDKDIKSAANVGYVSNKVNTAKGDVTVGLKNYFDRKINESHISSSTNKKDAFRYGRP